MVILSLRKSHSLLKLDLISHDLIQQDGQWVIVLRLTNIDLDMKNDSEKEAILHIFQQIINSFNTHVQIIQRRNEVDFSPNIIGVKSNILQHTNEKIIEYGRSYMDFLEGIVIGKLNVENYIAIKTDRRCDKAQAIAIFTGIKNQLVRVFKGINIQVIQIEGLELKKILYIPDFVREGVDYAVCGNKYNRTYVIQDYPRNGYPNWLRPLLYFPHPIQLTQHLHPFPREKMVRTLEMAIAKMESTVNMQKDGGFITSSELDVRISDAGELKARLASGKDNILEVTFLITITADSLEQLDLISFEIESAFRQIELKFRRARKEMNKALRSTFPICDNQLSDEVYTFDSRSFSTLLPFTVKNFTNGGILYGISEESSELITLDRFSMPNPNMIVLGTSGYGKSMFAKVVEISRQIISGAQALIIDHNGEYRQICSILGGQYVEEGEKPKWNSHMIVFGGDKVKALYIIWNHIISNPLRKRIMVIDEFHNILKQDKELILQVMREIRKFYTAPTLITQNIREFLRSDEGQMIMDLCSIKILMRQGENDLEEVERLFQLSKYEKMFLATCDIGHGYIYTNSFKTKFYVSYSDMEEKILTTNPQKKVGV